MGTAVECTHVCQHQPNIENLWHCKKQRDNFVWLLGFQVDIRSLHKLQIIYATPVCCSCIEIFKEEKKNKRKKKSLEPGVVYLSRIPPFMQPRKVRHLFSPFGTVGRIYLQPEGGWNIRTYSLLLHERQKKPAWRSQFLGARSCEPKTSYIPALFMSSYDIRGPKCAT